jgi:hypothetical protein
MDILSAPHFHDDEAARKYLEGILWPNGPVCPACGVIGRAYETSRPGVYRCAETACREDFTVTMKTVMERSHIALHKWLQGFHFMASSKKGYSAHQLHRTLGIGRKEGVEKRRGGAHKNIVLSLVERKGSVRSFHVSSTKKEDIIPIVKANIARETHVMTDESNTYSGLDKLFDKHGVVDHSRKEYAYTDRVSGISFGINSAEGYYSVFKRGMKGVYQHCKEKHLHRYVAEFDFRHSNRSALGVEDMERAKRIIAGTANKRLTYQGADRA